MNSETRIHSQSSGPTACQNCKKEFKIEPEDFKFYEKIKVPPPTFCPQCRLLHKMFWINGRNLYRRSCNAPGHEEEIISKYSSEKLAPVYDYKFWWSDGWDPSAYGKSFDFSKPFFEQLKELLDSVPVRNLDITNSINCDYCPSISNSKDCYLVGGGYMAEDCLYSNTPALSKRCIDSVASIMCDTLYESYGCVSSFNLAFAYNSYDCMDSKFLYDCHGCSNCFGCVGLRHKQYHIFNKPYLKEEYKREIQKFDIGSYVKLQEIIPRFNLLLEQYPRRFAEMKNAVDCTGNIIEHAKNCHYCFEIRNGAENCKYMLLAGRNIKDSYDVFGGGAKSELIYESMNILGGQKIFFSARVHNSVGVQHSVDCYSSMHLFGCVGLRHKEYCILNKQYSREEYEQLVPKIIEHMLAKPYITKAGLSYRYGDPFPIEIAPFAYNESDAQEWFLSNEIEARKNGYQWKAKREHDYQINLSAAELPDHIDNVSDSIIDQIIGCEHGGKCEDKCTTAFRIIPKELKFYRERNLALPRLCPNCRYFKLARFRPSYNLWRRQCMCLSEEALARKNPYKNTIEHFHGENRCQNEFGTSYEPTRPELLYCEQCYLREVV